MDQAELGIHEIEVIVQALAAGRSQRRLVGLLVVPRLVGVAALHRGNDMEKPARRMPQFLRATFQHLGDHLFLADMLLGDELDRNPGLQRQRLGVFPHTITQRRGKLRIIENANLVGVEKLRHPGREAHPRERPGHHHPIIAGQHPGNPIVIPLRQ
jgi:hypothetical protein